MFGVIVGLQYSASGGEGGARGFVAANVPAVASLQARVLQQADAASQLGESAATSAPTTTLTTTETTTATATTLQPLPQTEPGVVRNGAFAARVERMALFWEADRGDRYTVTATVTLSLHNLSDRPVSVAVISDSSISLALDNGYTLGGSYAVVSMNQCRRDECRYENLTRIEPGASVVLNMTLRTEADGSWAAVPQTQLPTLTRTQTASFSARLLLADDWIGPDRPTNVPDRAGARVVQLGFANVPIATPAGAR